MFFRDLRVALSYWNSDCYIHGMMDGEVIGQYWEARETINIVYVQTSDTLAEWLVAVQSELIALQWFELSVTAESLAPLGSASLSVL